MAAVTTILGMTPLFADAFFVAMAVTIAFGLGFATILTMVVVPVLYAIFYRAKYVEPGDPSEASATLEMAAATVDMAVPGQATKGAPSTDSPDTDSPGVDSPAPEPEPDDSGT